MRALLARELRLAWRSGAEILNPLWFFLIVITLFPFGVGAAPQLLAQIAPGVVWVAALLAALLVMDRLFRDDWQDGSPGATDAPADAAGGGGAGEGGCPLDDERPAAADRLAAGGAAAGDESA